MSSSVAIVAYLALFAVVGFVFVLVNLLIGRFLRPANPHPEKQEIYECGEPTIGSSFVQFDLRFYVVALVFIVFDVEVAFMFPWATVYGKATQLMRVGSDAGELPAVSVSPDGELVLTDDLRTLYQELGVRQPVLPDTEAGIDETAAVRKGAASLVQLAFWGMIVFFFVLLLGFAYEWKTGAMDWVRAVSRNAAGPSDLTASTVRIVDESVLSA